MVTNFEKIVKTKKKKSGEGIVKSKREIKRDDNNTIIVSD